MNKVIEGNFESINKIKFIGIGPQGISIINKLSEDKKNNIKLAAIDTNNSVINTNEKIYFSSYHGDDCLANEKFLNLIDEIDSQSEELFSLIKEEKMVILTWDIYDITSTQIALELGKHALKNDIIILPIVTGYEGKVGNTLDTKFYMKKVNKNIGPAINLSNKKVTNKISAKEDRIYDYNIIIKTIDLLLENIMSTCSVNLDYDDIKWLFEETGNDVQMCIASLNENDTEEDIKNKIGSSMLFRRGSRLPKKIIINLNASIGQQDEGRVYKVIQSVATSLQDISHKDCKITFSIKFTEKDDNTIDILTVQV